MRWSLAALTALALTTVGLWIWAKTRSPRPSGPPIIQGQILDDETHLVTPEMEAASASTAGQRLPDTVLIDSRGESHDLSVMAAQGPLVLIFIKDGCPCSTSAEPYFRRLHAAYGKKVPFVGVIDGTAETARQWVGDHGTPFPVANDADLGLMKALQVTNSAFVAVVAPGGSVQTLWPGFSKDMLTDLSKELAEISGLPFRAIDVHDAPGALYTGCPYPIDEAE